MTIINIGYRHLSKALITKGAKANQGEVVRLVGATGRVCGSHLHLEVERYGVKENPAAYLGK